ncbi:hypothetical protein C8R41DRAFT_923282 [Lentinula lateritia]|uniref:Uncharacterized protein n=1 Tax=Lentinula lateritia TaxID=40482 RepID=A0ABQ8V6A0_9AGAR|nr:hypothetical protein C8R41DRAFT_923282 [Lentinula lateritia]
MVPGVSTPISPQKPVTQLPNKIPTPSASHKLQPSHSLKCEFAATDISTVFTCDPKYPCSESHREDNGIYTQRTYRIQQGEPGRLLELVDQQKASIRQLGIQVQAQEAAAKHQQKQLSYEHARYLRVKLQKGQLEELGRVNKQAETEAASKLKEMNRQIEQRDEQAKKDAVKLKQYEEMMSSMEVEMIHMKKKTTMVHELCRKAGTILQAPYTFANDISLKDIQDVIEYRPQSTKVNRDPFSPEGAWKES